MSERSEMRRRAIRRATASTKVQRANLKPIRSRTTKATTRMTSSMNRDRPIERTARPTTARRVRAIAKATRRVTAETIVRPAEIVRVAETATRSRTLSRKAKRASQTVRRPASQNTKKVNPKANRTLSRSPNEKAKPN